MTSYPPHGWKTTHAEALRQGVLLINILIPSDPCHLLARPLVSVERLAPFPQQALHLRAGNPHRAPDPH